MVTVNNWSALSDIYRSFKANETTFRNEYKSMISNSLSQEYALLFLFNNVTQTINLYKAPFGSTNYVPRITDDNTGEVNNKLCP